MKQTLVVKKKHWETKKEKPGICRKTDARESKFMVGSCMQVVQVMSETERDI